MSQKMAMTPLAARVLAQLPQEHWVSVTDVARITGLSAPRCQLLLTQFTLAGLVRERADGSSFQRRP